MHDRGRLALLVMLMLAMGGTSLTDIEYLRIHKVLFAGTWHLCLRFIVSCVRSHSKH